MIKIINELLEKLIQLEKAMQENNQRRVGSIMFEMRYLLLEALKLAGKK